MRQGSRTGQGKDNFETVRACSRTGPLLSALWAAAGFHTASAMIGGSGGVGDGAKQSSANCT